MDPKRSAGVAPTKVFTEAQYRADAGRVILHAIAEGRAIVARDDGSPRVIIAIPAAESTDTLE